MFHFREFIKDVDSSLQQYKVVPITDPFGPSIVDPNLQLIIGSQETEKGCKKVNQVRKEKQLSQLDVHVIGKIKYNVAFLLCYISDQYPQILINMDD